MVRVPVLSEQITEVQPRVSTDGRLRTMAFFLAMRRGAECKTGRDNSWKTFWDGSDGQSNGDLEVINGTLKNDKHVEDHPIGNTRNIQDI